MKKWMLRVATAILFASLESKSSESSVDAQRYDQLRTEISQLSEVLPRLEHETIEKKNEAQANQRRAIAQVYDTQLKELFQRKRSEISQSVRDLEALIQHRPQDPSFTPHALFLLGERNFALADLGDDSNGQPNFEPTIQIFKRILEEFPHFIYLDATLYMLGICSDYMSHEQESLKYFQRLVTQFPKSRFVPESTFRIGNNFFDQRKFQEAIAAYLPLASDKSSAFYERALYKSAWAHYLQSEFSEAIVGFVKVLDNNKQASEGPRNSILEEEAKEYLAFSFVDAELEKSDSGVEIVRHVSDFFAKRGKTSWEREVWLHLGGILLRVSRPEGAVLSFERAIHLDESAPDNVAISSRVIAIYEELKQKQKALVARENLVERLNNAAQKDSATLRDNLYTLGLDYHSLAKEESKLGKKAEAKAAYGRAAERYAQYAREFNQEDNTDEVIYYLAETLYELEDFRNSAARYAQVRDWPWPTTRREDAALNVVYSFEKEIEREQKANRLPFFDLGAVNVDNRMPDSTPLPTLLVEYIGSVDGLVKQNPKNELSPAFLYKAAHLYLIYGWFDEAAVRLQNIIAAYPHSQSARLAATTLVNEKIARSDWAAVSKEASVFASTFDKGQSEFKTIAFSARFKLANALFAESKFEQAAQTYRQLMQENPQSEYADKILYNEMMALERMGDDHGSMKALQQLLRDHPKSELAPNALISKIKNLASRLKFKEAASTAAQYVSLFPKSANTPDLFLDQCFYLEANQEFKKAAEVCEAFASSYPNRGETTAALMKSAKLFARASDKMNEKRVLEKILVRGQKQLPVTEPVLEARYVLLGNDFDSYQRMKIDAQLGKNQSTQLTNKTALLADLKRKYEQIIVDAGASLWSIASLEKIGALYEGLYRSLIDAPCPKDVARVDSEACDEYQSILEDKAFVLQQKAIESYELAIQRAPKINDSANARTLAREGLYRLQPDKYVLPDSPIFVSIKRSKLTPEKSDRHALGENLVADGRYEAARIFFSDAIARDDGDVNAHLGLAQVLYKLNLDLASTSEFQKVLSLDPTNAEAFDGLGMLAVKSSDDQGAQEFFAKASALDKSSAIYASHLANAHYALGSFSQALAENQRAYSLDSEMAALHFNLGLLYLSAKFDELNDLARLSLSKSEFEKYLQSEEPLNKKRTEALIKIVEQKLFIENQRQQREKK